ncbi:nucleotide-diphospho-sugar transferase-domain-containing protein [Cunninghamella echinulata]|nr:nucleotide-diphospho-sugar transferase-domain-containing protein [Cunninghamella echinulata]
MTGTEWILRKRSVFIILGIFLVLSLFSIRSTIHNSPYVDDVSSSMDIDTDLSTTSTTNSEKNNVSTTTPVGEEEEDQPEAENLVEVLTKPTTEEEFTPKEFEPISKPIQDIIKKNLMKHKKDNILLTAVANGGMADYTLNWIASLERTKLSKKFLVFAINQELTDILTEKGYGDHVVNIPQEWFHQKLSGDEAKWLSKEYLPITHAKSLVVERLLYMDVTVWFSDVDIVFTSPAIYDYLMMKLDSRKTTEMLFTQETEQKILNSGFYIMRPTLAAKRVLADSIVITDKEPKVSQQRAMNRIIDDMNLNYQNSKIALLDLALFPHGRMYFERKVPTKYGLEPFMVHANYRIGDEKRKSLQGADLWYL